MKNSAEYAFSIKKRLTIAVVLLSTVLILVSLFFSFTASQHEIEEVYDARLGQSAKMLLLGMPVKEDGLEARRASEILDTWMARIAKQSKGGDSPTTFGHPYERNILIQFYLSGELVWSSIPTISRVAHDPRYAGFGYLDIEGKPWRFFQLPLPTQYHTQPEYVIVAEKQSIRDEMSRELALSTALPQLILIPCLALVMALLIGKHFEPISELKRAITQRNANKLDSIYVSNPTQELSPLVDSLNRLLTELDQAWQRERRFTRMAAHELKTPLTVLRLNAENALLSQNEAQLKSDLSNILRGIERTDRLIQQLLMLARVESIHDLTFSSINLTKLVQGVVAELVPLALRNQQELSLDGDDIFVLGDESLLRILFTNLVDNAIRYSGAGSQIKVEVQEEGQVVNVWVSDTGEALSEEAREKLFENFYRANTEKGDGAGLGMSITKDIAKLHHGTITLMPRENERNTFWVVLPNA
ncbi:ATP-binding protein [Vibrio furnissii]|uniref:ATP-binding protein n=1 Tax=Vibrio furnissii TaxID=29494 RepID=UPI001EECDC69|nr:ATP-binding protein [Vibrio furnissii]MCG6217545.1 ATP-binding protein [Vibrio furnissii]